MIMIPGTRKENDLKNAYALSKTLFPIYRDHNENRAKSGKRRLKK